MTFRDRFRRKQPASGSAPASTGGTGPAIQVLATVSKAEMAYWKTVQALNEKMALRVASGQGGDMEPELQIWFLENAAQPANPTELGMMWYLAPETGRVQLVLQSVLEAIGMDKPENQPGTTRWAMAPEAMPSAEAAQRKARSMAMLEQRQIPTNDSLPVLEESGNATLRSSEDIANRAVCLMGVALKAEVFNEGDIVEWHPVLVDIIEVFGLADALSPQEQAFVENMAPDQQTATQFLWRYEALTVMLWALGFVDELGHPSAICDVQKVVGIIKEQGPEGLKTNARLRSLDAVLDEADLAYRLHWAIRQAQLDQSSEVPATNASVVMERHYALNWLLASRAEAWDEVSTNT